MYLNAPVVARDKKSQLIYVVVEFWNQKADRDAGQPPFLLNDFLMQIAPTVTSIRTVGGQWVRLDGVRVNPENVTEADDAIGWQMVTTTKTNPQIVAEVEANILRYWRRAVVNGYEGDNRSFRDVDEADPDGVLSKTLSYRGFHDYPDAPVRLSRTDNKDKKK